MSIYEKVFNWVRRFKVNKEKERFIVVLEKCIFFGEYDKVIECLIKSFEISLEVGNRYVECVFFSNMVGVYYVWV